MEFDQFKSSLSHDQPPSGSNVWLQALWHDAKGNWQQAHELVQDAHSVNGYWIHAYLHRRQGDPGNAAYWYHLAGRPVPNNSLDEEWDIIVTSLL